MNLGRIAGLGAAAIGIGGGGIALSTHNRNEDDRRRTEQDRISGKGIACRSHGDTYIPAHRERGKWVPGVCIDR